MTPRRDEEAMHADTIPTAEQLDLQARIEAARHDPRAEVPLDAVPPAFSPSQAYQVPAEVSQAAYPDGRYHREQLGSYNAPKPPVRDRAWYKAGRKVAWQAFRRHLRCTLAELGTTLRATWRL